MGIKKAIGLLVTSLLLATNVQAGADGTVGKITALRFAEEGVFIHFANAPTACNGGSQARMHAILQKTHSNYETMVSGLITAHATQKTVDWIFYLDSSVPASCNSSLLIITALELGQ